LVQARDAFHTGKVIFEVHSNASLFWLYSIYMRGNSGLELDFEKRKNAPEDV
jgi:hypothetical protein